MRAQVATRSYTTGRRAGPYGAAIFGRLLAVLLGFPSIILAASESPGLVVACPQSALVTVDREGLVRIIEARLAAERGYLERDSELERRMKSGENVSVERTALKKERPSFADLKDGAVRVVCSDPADAAAFHAIGVVLRTTGREQKGATEREMARLLLKYHVGRSDFVEVAQYLNLGDSPATEQFWNEVYRRAHDHSVRGRALVFEVWAYQSEVDGFGLSVARQHAVRSAIERDLVTLRATYSDVPYAQDTVRRVSEGLQYAPGTSMPAISAQTVDGHTDSLTHYRGKFVLLDFWATWCPTCVESHAELAAFKAQMAGKPFELIGINVDENADDLAVYMKRHALPWVNWHVDPRSPLLRDWGILGYPTYMLLDPAGILMGRTNAMTPERRDYVRLAVDGMSK